MIASGFTLGNTIRKRMALPPLISRSILFYPSFTAFRTVTHGSSLETAQCGIYNMIGVNTCLDTHISHLDRRPSLCPGNAWKFTRIVSKL
jgi:hypothetical protein